jgi:hypothetical protein
MRRTIDGVTLINAGTLLTGMAPCCNVVDLHAGSVQVYSVSEHGDVSDAPGPIA